MKTSNGTNSTLKALLTGFIIMNSALVLADESINQMRAELQTKTQVFSAEVTNRELDRAGVLIALSDISSLEAKIFAAQVQQGDAHCAVTSSDLETADQIAMESQQAYLNALAANPDADLKNLYVAEMKAQANWSALEVSRLNCEK